MSTCEQCGDQLDDGQSWLCADCDTVGEIAAQHEMLCPKCGSDSRMEVVAQIWVRLVDDGTDDSDDLNQDYGDDSCARCRECDWRGTVGQMHYAYTMKGNPGLAEAIQAMRQDDWTPMYSKWRHGGWYVSNVYYPNGANGCVSSNYDDHKWRIVCANQNDITYPSRDAAARAERDLALAQHAAFTKGA